MLFNYKARTPEGQIRSGTVDAISIDAAVQVLQRQSLIVVSLEPAGEDVPWYARSIFNLQRVKAKDTVILARQLSTLFEAKVPVVQAFKTLIGETQSVPMRENLSGVLDDIQGGMAMSQAMARHPVLFSPFFVNMVRSGEESGKLDEAFEYLADHMERNYTLMSKAKNALVYPAFILVAFVVVMILMITVIVPSLSSILLESGQKLPLYTRAIIGIGDFARAYGFFVLVALIVLLVFLIQYLRTPAGRVALSRTQISLPVIGGLFRKIYLARMADNLQTLIAGGLPIVRSLQITADVVGNEIYRAIILEAVEAVRGGSTIADAFGKHPEIAPLLTQMIRVGEETGKLDHILKALSRFYSREVDSFIDNLVSLIEPVLIVILGLGVGIMVAAVLVPIYNLASAF